MRPHASAILDLRLFKLATFRASIFGGFMFRLGLVHCRFCCRSCCRSDLILRRSNPALSPSRRAWFDFMKAAVARVLKRFGYRPVLVYNSFISAAFLAACASFVPGMPYAAMVAILLAGAFSLAAIHCHQHDRLCRNRAGANE